MCGCCANVFPFSLFRRKRTKGSVEEDAGSAQVARRPSWERNPVVTPQVDGRSSRNDNSITTRSNIKQEMLSKELYDTQPSENDSAEPLVEEQHPSRVYEREPRKTNDVPDDVQPTDLIQDTEKLPRKMDDVQPLDANPPIEVQDGVQLSEAPHNEEPQVTIRFPDGKQEIPKMEGKVLEMAIVPENPLDVREQEPRKRVNEQQEPSLVEDRDDTSVVNSDILDIHQERESTIPHAEEPQVITQFPDSKQEIQKMEGKTPEIPIVPVDPLDVREQQPRKRVSEQQEPPLEDRDDTSVVDSGIVDIHQEPESTIPHAKEPRVVTHFQTASRRFRKWRERHQRYPSFQWTLLMSASTNRGG
ncbi:hypothetical protein OG21DRAFT_1079202 [Imleria badia]|nr:hypothetical protein OG21DRAFT_1079202 [Imleria badia]